MGHARRIRNGVGSVTASVAYVAYLQASWTVLLGAMVALALLMVLALMFLAGLAAIVRAWRWRA
jgi:hypothetical protein